MWQNWRAHLSRTPANGDAPSQGRLDPPTLRRIVQSVVTTRPDELSCDECFEMLDRFAELVLAGHEIPDAFRLVQDHLERCGDCREEFEALLDALRALNGSA